MRKRQAKRKRNSLLKLNDPLRVLKLHERNVSLGRQWSLGMLGRLVWSRQYLECQSTSTSLCSPSKANMSQWCSHFSRQIWDGTWNQGNNQAHHGCPSVAECCMGPSSLFLATQLQYWWRTAHGARSLFCWSYAYFVSEIEVLSSMFSWISSSPGGSSLRLARLRASARTDYLTERYSAV